MVWLLKSINCWLPEARRVYLGKNCCKLTLALCSFPRQVLLMVTRDMICVRMRHWGVFVACFPTSLAVWLHLRTWQFGNIALNDQTTSYNLFSTPLFIHQGSLPVCHSFVQEFLSYLFSVAPSISSEWLLCEMLIPILFYLFCSIYTFTSVSLALV